MADLTAVTPGTSGSDRRVGHWGWNNFRHPQQPHVRGGYCPRLNGHPREGFDAKLRQPDRRGSELRSLLRLHARARRHRHTDRVGDSVADDSHHPRADGTGRIRGSQAERFACSGTRVCACNLCKLQ